MEAGILHHEEGVDLMPANIELSGVETYLINCSPNLEQLILNVPVAAETPAMGVSFYDFFVPHFVYAVWYHITIWGNIH